VPSPTGLKHSSTSDGCLVLPAELICSLQIPEQLGRFTFPVGLAYFFTNCLVLCQAITARSAVSGLLRCHQGQKFYLSVWLSTLCSHLLLHLYSHSQTIVTDKAEARYKHPSSTWLLAERSDLQQISNRNPIYCSPEPRRHRHLEELSLERIPESQYETC